MAIVFRCVAAPTVSLNQDLARLVLNEIGHAPGEQGVLTVEQLPEAIERLEQRISVDPEAKASGSDDSAERRALAQHLDSFIDMLKIAADAGKPVTWGV